MQERNVAVRSESDGQCDEAAEERSCERLTRQPQEISILCEVELESQLLDKGGPEENGKPDVE